MLCLTRRVGESVAARLPDGRWLTVTVNCGLASRLPAT